MKENIPWSGRLEIPQTKPTKPSQRHRQRHFSGLKVTYTHYDIKMWVEIEDVNEGDDVQSYLGNYMEQTEHA